MIFLNSFHMLSKEEDENFFKPNSPTFKRKSHSTYHTTEYPFVLFRERDLPDFVFDHITIFYGNNGSGKSTILNVMAEALKLDRVAPYNRSDYFDDYVELCHYELAKPLSGASRIITSDDVFDRLLDIRRINEGIDHKKSNAIMEYISERSSTEPNRLQGLDDYERWKTAFNARKKSTTMSQYLRARVMSNLQERSNGESAFSFFVESITDGALYLLDEPENSLSPKNQVMLKYFIEDCVRNHDCQFVISTHSPFILSLRGAKIYDIDSVPVNLNRWTELEGVRVYYNFFSEHMNEFEH